MVRMISFDDEPHAAQDASVDNTLRELSHVLYPEDQVVERAALRSVGGKLFDYLQGEGLIDLAAINTHIREQGDRL